MFTCLAPGAIGVKADLEQGLDYANKGGFAGLDVNIRQAADLVQSEGVAHVKALFSDRGLRMWVRVEWQSGRFQRGAESAPSVGGGWPVDRVKPRDTVDTTGLRWPELPGELQIHRQTT